MPIRALLLELAARKDGFLGDGGVSDLEPRLKAAGHEVARLASSAAAGAGGAEAWHAELEGLVRSGGFELVVVPRVWDRETVAAIRRGLEPGARVVRLSNGVAAALDDAFDRVLDTAGVVELARGGEPATSVFRRSNAQELRRLRVLEVAPPERQEQASGLPVIRGPATGCPYMADARALPAFAALELDRDVIQTRGCTFCLDQTGAYAAASEDETVAAWLSGLRSLRQRRPEVREVLLVDERPHRYLPRLFDELGEAPELHGIELLVKSRVDWLIEFESDLARAAVAAERSNGVLHVYLVGFESFDQATLDLFNKGVSVAENRQAVALLRSLGGRFPKSFEYRRLRAHGFVAFTPWTTPESLLDNAAALRELDFAELRAEASRTRLRLYPRTPLHALAHADGLLVDEFPDGRGDRAAEQGYDASAPWRFRDARVEAVWQTLESLRERKLSLGDAELIEFSTRFVLRWPGLAAEPAGAGRVLFEILRGWQLPFDELYAALGPAAIVDLELERLQAGEKRAALKEGIPRADVEAVVAAYRAMGFAAAVAEAHGVDATGGAHRPGADFAIVAVAADAATLAEVLRQQAARATPAMGALMGYPPCCAEAFAAQPDRRDNVENERSTFRRAPTARLEPLLGRLGRVRLISHHLCRADCEPSRALAALALSRLSRSSPAAAAWIEAELRRSVLFLDHARRLSVTGAWRGDRFELASCARLSEREIAPGFENAAALELAPDSVSAVFADGTRLRVGADRPLLAVPGEPLARSVLENVQSRPLERAERGPVARRMHWLELTPDYRCNNRCLGCPSARPVEGPVMSSAEAASLLREGRRGGAESLWLGGGEPTLRRDLVALVREARRLGYRRVRLQTNGMLLAYADLVRRLGEAGVTEISVSIKGANVATHDHFTETPGSFDLLCRGIAEVQKARLPVEGDVLVYRSNTRELPEIVRGFFERGVQRFRIWSMAPDAGDERALAEEPRIAEVAAAVRAAAALRLSSDPEHLVSLHTPPCTLPGDLARARFYAPELGLVVANPGGQRFFLEDSPIEGGAFAPACDGCALRSRCNGVRPGYLSRHGALELSPEPLA